MKFILALVACASAIRFDSTTLSDQEEENLIAPTLIANGAMPTGQTTYQRTFSQALADNESGAVHWDTEFRANSQDIMAPTNAPVIQPSQDMLTHSERMRLAYQANEELEIRHSAPLPDAAMPQEAPAKSPKQIEYEAAMHNKMFPAFHDDKEMGDSRISSDMLKVAGV